MSASTWCRGDGRLIVGATVEERGFDTTVTAGGVHELLREAYRLIPEIAELELVEATAGLRPGTPDNAPLIGCERNRGAPGRHGTLPQRRPAGPVDRRCIVALLAGEDPSFDIAPFSPQRFAGRSAEPAVEIA